MIKCVRVYNNGDLVKINFFKRIRNERLVRI